MAGLDEFSRLLEARLNAEAENAAPATRKARRHRRATGSYAGNSTIYSNSNNLAGEKMSEHNSLIRP